VAWLAFFRRCGVSVLLLKKGDGVKHNKTVYIVNVWMNVPFKLGRVL
jgi:hypothetical protein